VSSSTSTFTIRRARPDDGPAVRRIVFGTLEAYGIVPDPEGKDHDVVSFGAHDESVDEFVAEIAGTVVGSVMIAPRDHGTAWLSKFFVDASWRGRGVGRTLLERAVGTAKARGYRRLELDTRTFFKEATHLYEATGWKRGLDPAGSDPCVAIYALELS
jgi:predicted N-acetyltransferase YhbS